MNEQEILIKQKIRLEKFKVVSNIILIILFLIIGFYIYSEIENFKMLGKDVCRLCEEKTGGQCLKGYGVTAPCPSCKCNVVNLSEIDLDSLFVND